MGPSVLLLLLLYGGWTYAAEAPDLPRLKRLALLESIRTVESGAPQHQRDDVEGDGGEAVGKYQVQLSTAATELDLCKLKREPRCPLTPKERAWLKRILLDPQVNRAVANLKLDHCERLGYRTAAGKLACYHSRSDYQEYVAKALPLYRSALRRLKNGPHL